MNTLLLLVFFVALLVLIEILLGVIMKWKHPEKQQAEKRLKELTAGKYDFEDLELVKTIKYSDIPSLDAFLSRFSMFRKMVRSLEQANVKQPLGYYILLTILAVPIGFGLTKINLLFGIVVIIGLGVLPTSYIYFKKKKRMQKFEKQLPDAMDLIGRSLRAGLAFSAGIKIVSEEFPDPVGIEFAKTVNEINFGISTDEALKSLADRIECQDLKFFVISVILQKETGGNLAEILENSSRIIRERFKFHGKVRALSAEGRISTYILVAIPFFIASVIWMFNRDYIKTLVDEPAGNIMIIMGLVLMIAGVISLKKMVKLNV